MYLIIAFTVGFTIMMVIAWRAAQRKHITRGLYGKGGADTIKLSPARRTDYDHHQSKSALEELQQDNELLTNVLAVTLPGLTQRITETQHKRDVPEIIVDAVERLLVETLGLDERVVRRATTSSKPWRILPNTFPATVSGLSVEPGS